MTVRAIIKVVSNYSLNPNFTVCCSGMIIQLLVNGWFKLSNVIFSSFLKITFMAITFFHILRLCGIIENVINILEYSLNQIPS